MCEGLGAACGVAPPTVETRASSCQNPGHGDTGFFYEVCIGPEVGFVGVVLAGSPPALLEVEGINADAPEAVLNNVNIGDFLVAVDGSDVRALGISLAQALRQRPVRLAFQRGDGSTAAIGMTRLTPSGPSQKGSTETFAEPVTLPLRYEFEAGLDEDLLGIVPGAWPPEPLRIESVLDGSAAAARGVLPDDIILAIDGSDVQALPRTAIVAFLRRRPLRLSIMRSCPTEARSYELVFGVKDTILGIVPDGRPPGAVFVQAVVEPSAASIRGVLVGDEILAVDNEEVSTMAPERLSVALRRRPIVLRLAREVAVGQPHGCGHTGGTATIDPNMCDPVRSRASGSISDDSERCVGFVGPRRGGLVDNATVYRTERGGRGSAATALNRSGGSSSSSGAKQRQRSQQQLDEQQQQQQQQEWQQQQQQQQLQQRHHCSADCVDVEPSAEELQLEDAPPAKLEDAPLAKEVDAWETLAARRSEVRVLQEVASIAEGARSDSRRECVDDDECDSTNAEATEEEEEENEPEWEAAQAEEDEEGELWAPEVPADHWARLAGLEQEAQEGEDGGELWTPKAPDWARQSWSAWPVFQHVPPCSDGKGGVDEAKHMAVTSPRDMRGQGADAPHFGQGQLDRTAGGPTSIEPLSAWLGDAIAGGPIDDELDGAEKETARVGRGSPLQNHRTRSTTHCAVAKDLKPMLTPPTIGGATRPSSAKHRPQPRAFPSVKSRPQPRAYPSLRRGTHPSRPGACDVGPSCGSGTMDGRGWGGKKGSSPDWRPSQAENDRSGVTHAGRGESRATTLLSMLPRDTLESMAARSSLKPRESASLTP